MYVICLHYCVLHKGDEGWTEHQFLNFLVLLHTLPLLLHTCRRWWCRLQSNPQSSQQWGPSPRQQPTPPPSGWSLEALRDPQLHTHKHTHLKKTALIRYLDCCGQSLSDHYSDCGSSLLRSLRGWWGHLWEGRCRSSSPAVVVTPHRCPRGSWWRRGPSPS